MIKLRGSHKLYHPIGRQGDSNIMATSKNVIPAKAGIYNKMKLLDSRLRGSDKIAIIRGSLISYSPLWEVKE